MRKQQKIWDNEHRTIEAFPAYLQPKPSSTVITFLNFLNAEGVNPPLRAIDIGCGKGRNAIYLAIKGYTVFAIDYIKRAVDYAKSQAVIQQVQDRIQFYTAAIDKPWPFGDAMFDIAIDCFSSIDIETKKGRGVYKNEMLRTLKPGGYAMVSVVSANDEFEKEMRKQSPGAEKNSVIWPSNGKFQKDYDKEELKEFYKEFRIKKLYETKKSAYKLNRRYNATNYLVILQKPTT